MLEEDARKDVLDVDKKRHAEENGAEFVDKEDGSKSAHKARQTARPDALTEAQRETGGCEPEKSTEKGSMQIALATRETLNVTETLVFLFLGFLGCLRQFRHDLLH